MGTQKNCLNETVRLSTETYAKTNDVVHIYNFTLKMFVNLDISTHLGSVPITYVFFMENTAKVCIGILFSLFLIQYIRYGPGYVKEPSQ